MKIKILRTIFFICGICFFAGEFCLAQEGTAQHVSVIGYRFHPTNRWAAYDELYANRILDIEDTNFFLDPSGRSVFSVMSCIDIDLDPYLSPFPGDAVIRNAAGSYSIDMEFGEAHLANLTTAARLTMGDESGVWDQRSAGKYVYDLAEGMEIKNAQAGDVVVISKDKDLCLEKSTRAYDLAVAGVVSESPKILMGSDADKKPLALAGIVKCNVSAENGAIKKGDLLVCSATPGYAMRADAKKVTQGMILGLALEPLSQGTGKIFILVNK